MNNIILIVLFTIEFLLFIYLGTKITKVLKYIFKLFIIAGKITARITQIIMQIKRIFNYNSENKFNLEFDVYIPDINRISKHIRILSSAKILNSLFVVVSSLLLITTGTTMAYFTDTNEMRNNTISTGDWTPPDTYVTNVQTRFDYLGRNVVLENTMTVSYHAEDTYTPVDEVDLYYCYGDYTLGTAHCSDLSNWNFYATDTSPDDFVYDGSFTFIAPSGDGYYLFQARGRDRFSPANEEYLGPSEFEVELDTTPPTIQFTSIDGESATDGMIISGEVTIEGTVDDVHPHHYHLRAFQGHQNIPSGTLVSNFNSAVHPIFGDDVIEDLSPRINESLFPTITETWDTTQLADGEYTIFLGARDTSNFNGNRAGSNANNDERLHVVVDNTTPDITDLTVSPDYVAQDLPSWGGTIENQITVTAHVTDPSEVSAVSADFSYNSEYTDRPTPTSVAMTDPDNDDIYEVTYAIPANWRNGTLYIKVAARDKTSTGNWGRGIQMDTVEIDNQQIQIINVTTDKSTYTGGEIITLDVTIENTGDVDVTTGQLRVGLDKSGSRIGSTSQDYFLSTDPPLTPGSSRTISFTQTVDSSWNGSDYWYDVAMYGQDLPTPSRWYWYDVINEAINLTFT